MREKRNISTPPNASVITGLVLGRADYIATLKVSIERQIVMVGNEMK